MRPLPLLASMLALRRGLAMSTAGPREVRITQALTKTFAPQHLEVLNESHGRREDESHFKVVVVSDKFEGVKPLIKRHRLVTAAITADTDGKLDFHSLSVAAAKTPSPTSSVVRSPPNCSWIPSSHPTDSPTSVPRSYVG